MRIAFASAAHFNAYAAAYDDMANPQKMFKVFKVSEDYLAEALTKGDANIYVKKLYGNRVVHLMNAGDVIVNYILAQKVIPSTEAKRFEKAAKAVTGGSRAPNKPYAWWLKNKDVLDVLIDADRWKDKDSEEGTGLVQKVQGFDLINQAPSLKEKDYDLIVEDFKKALTLIGRSGVIHAKSLFYGNSIISPEISQKNVLAFYSPREDAIYLKPSTKDRANMIHTIIHELGHRLWNKFLDAESKKLWKSWHIKCGYASADISMPGVGDPLPVPIRGHKVPPVVTKIEGLNFYVNDRDFVRYDQIANYLRMEIRYPSMYSSTNEEEHFCEAFAFYCLGELTDNHRLNFEALFKR